MVSRLDDVATICVLATYAQLGHGMKVEVFSFVPQLVVCKIRRCVHVQLLSACVYCNLVLLRPASRRCYDRAFYQHFTASA